MPQTSILVVGVGNAFRGDDAVGLLAVRKLMALGIPGIEIREHSGEGVSLMELWKGHDSVIVVDAVSSGADPGTLVFHNAVTDPLPPQLFSCSTHNMGVAEAVELSRSLDSLPERLHIVGIEGRAFEQGEPMSETVQSVLDERVQAIREFILNEYREKS